MAFMAILKHAAGFLSPTFRLQESYKLLLAEQHLNLCYGTRWIQSFVRKILRLERTSRLKRKLNLHCLT